jgi:hypothetical protein
MASPIPSLLERQVARVQRRLFLQTLLNVLIGCWSGAFVLAAAWFLIQPWLLADPAPGLRWAIAGGILGVATVSAGVLAALRTPPRIAAALSLDERFGLKERVTTSLTLAPEQVNTPAAQALLADVQERLRQLDVGSRYPVRVSWTAALVPVGAAILAFVALFYDPLRGQATSTITEPGAQAPANAADINEKMKQLKKRSQEPRDGKPKSEELEKFEAELEKIANRPRDSKDELRERIKEMTALEDAMKSREKEMADRSRSLRQQLQQMERLAQNSQGEGPAKDLHKALAEGKLDQAKEEIEGLAKKLQNKELTNKEKEQLQRQLQDLQDKLERMAQQKDKEEQLKKANLDPETLKRELAELEKDKQKLKDLQQLANKLGQAQKALRQGNMDEAAGALAGAGEQLKEMNLDDQELQDLREQLKRLQDAKDSC